MVSPPLRTRAADGRGGEAGGQRGWRPPTGRGRSGQWFVYRRPPWRLRPGLPLVQSAWNVPTRVCRGPWTRSVDWRSACSSLALNGQARLFSAMEGSALSSIGQETFQPTVTGWRVWQLLARTHGHTTWITSTAGHGAVTTWTACRTTAFRLPQWSLAQMKTVLVRDADGRQTCDGLMTAVPSRCCPECVSLCRRRTGRT